jgi:hypothetical protein
MVLEEKVFYIDIVVVVILKNKILWFEFLMNFLSGMDLIYAGNRFKRKSSFFILIIIKFLMSRL